MCEISVEGSFSAAHQLPCYRFSEEAQVPLDSPGSRSKEFFQNIQAGREMIIQSKFLRCLQRFFLKHVILKSKNA